MKKIYAKNSFLLTVVSLILLVSACAGPKAQTALLPDGMSLAMAPGGMPLDAYLYIRQSQPTGIPGSFFGLPSDAAIQSIEAWAVPSGSSESVGTVITLAAQRDASALYPFIPDRPDLWKMLSGSNIYVVWGTGSGAEGLKTAISARRFVSLKEAEKDAWNLMERLPGSPEAKPLAAGFVRINERLIDFVQKKSPGGPDESMASNVKLARIEMAAVAFYTSRDLKILDFMSPASLRDSGPGGIMIARSSYPGFVISTALGQAASRLNIEKTQIDGKPAYYRIVDIPGGEKVHIYFNNSGQYIYAHAAADIARSQQLFRWVWNN